MLRKSFEKWGVGELHHAFGLKRHYENFKPLDDWLAVTPKISATDKERLDELKKDLIYNTHYWNEAELKVFLIGQLLAISKLKSEHYKIFLKRKIKATANNVALKGVVDLVIAEGIGKPINSYFVLHQCKPAKKKTNNVPPIAQLLSRMLAVQAINDKKHPIYGCYMLEWFCFFVVLDGTDYGVSKVYNPCNDDIYQIVALMREARNYILDILGVAS